MNHTKVLILGADGYLGWALWQYLKLRGYEVFGVDNFSRRELVEKVGSDSLMPIGSVTSAIANGIVNSNICEYPELMKIHSFFKPDVIVHLAEQPSAPYSMRGVNECIWETQVNNIAGTQSLLWYMEHLNPEAHLIKLGTMGEYSDWIYKGFPIPEEPTVQAMLMDGGQEHVYTKIPTPRSAGSFYHWSKIFDSNNIEFACKIWGLRATDLNQGVVYGTRVDDLQFRTRFDYDSYFGTTVNRFVTQAAVGIPLTVYGLGGQTRGFININDTMRAIELVIENPPKQREFRIVNQLTEVFSVNEIALMVRQHTGCEIDHIKNPRIEREEHLYNPKAEKLREWGLTDPRTMNAMLPEMVEDVAKYSGNIRLDVIQPQARWKEPFREEAVV
jgi:UDP-sulfoquinovose synthase